MSIIASSTAQMYYMNNASDVTTSLQSKLPDLLKGFELFPNKHAKGRRGGIIGGATNEGPNQDYQLQ